jgi:hypothetical protein
MYDLALIDTKLSVQLAVDPGDATLCTAFRDFVVSLQQFQVYLAMLGGQSYITMVDTPGVCYSIKVSTSAYQGKIMVFFGDRRATKESTPVCLPTTKS